MKEWCAKCRVETWAYGLMPYHVPLIAVPGTAESLWSAVGEARRRHTRPINFNQGLRGHPWQAGFRPYPLDESRCLEAARCVELNPVKAKMVERGEDCPLSIAKTRPSMTEDGTVRVGF